MHVRYGEAAGENMMANWEGGLAVSLEMTTGYPNRDKQGREGGQDNICLQSLDEKG